MKILFYTPWGNRWKESTSKAFESMGWETEWTDGNGKTFVPDAIFSMWANEFVIQVQEKITDYRHRLLTSSCDRSFLYDIPLFTYIRHYEAFTTLPQQIDWSRIKGLFFCSPHVQQICNTKWPYLKKVPQYVILNWMDTDEWGLKANLKPNKKLCMVGRLQTVKNFPLALQIMKHLPEDYILDIAGAVQDESLIWYMQNFLEDNNLLDRVIFHDYVKDIKGFLQDKTFILSTSYREGCPMNVLEAMSMGVKPIIHNWFGAKEIFGKYVWDTIEEAVQLIMGGDYEPGEYREFVQHRHGIDNATKVAGIVSELLSDNEREAGLYLEPGKYSQYGEIRV